MKIQVTITSFIIKYDFIDEAVSPDTEDPENANENSDAEKNGNSTNERVSTRKWAEETNYDPIKIFKKVFVIHLMLALSNFIIFCSIAFS